jgi:hypothetical protein
MQTGGSTQTARFYTVIAGKFITKRQKLLDKANFML